MNMDKHVELFRHISQKEVVELTQKLVRFKSINPPGNELEIALYIGDLLKKEGLEVEVLKHSDSRGSVVAKLVGGEDPGLIYCGHLDVVPAEGDWQRDPFSGDVSEGKIWGRGTTDMKAGVAAMIAAASAAAREGLALKGPLYLSFTAGEETDNFGAEETLKHYKFGPVKAVFISEPTANEVYTAEKGALWLEIRTYGRAAHISRMEEGRNSLMMMLPILEALENMKIPFENHPLLGDYRRSPNAICAGANTNTIPAECVVKVDQRTLPGQNHKEIVNKIRDMIGDIAQKSELADFKAEVRVILDNPPLEVDYQEPILQKLFEITSEINGKKQEGPKGVGYFTDAVKFTPNLGIPFAICGPGNPDLNHQANEWVEITKIMDSAKIYAVAAAEYLCDK
jgi:succinyl-diaminopimelate desuccinylase